MSYGRFKNFPGKPDTKSTTYYWDDPLSTTLTPIRPVTIDMTDEKLVKIRIYHITKCH